MIHPLRKNKVIDEVLALVQSNWLPVRGAVETSLAFGEIDRVGDVRVPAASYHEKALLRSGFFKSQSEFGELDNVTVGVTQVVMPCDLLGAGNHVNSGNSFRIGGARRVAHAAGRIRRRLPQRRHHRRTESHQPRDGEASNSVARSAG